MGLLSEDMQRKALLKIRTAEFKKRKGRVLGVMETLLVRSNNLNNKLKKKTQVWMDTRNLVWAQYSKRKKEFEKDAFALLADEDVDFVLCHDSKSINVASKAAKRHKAVLGFDLVEMTFANLRGFEPGPINKLKLRRKENKVGKAPFMISGDPYLTKEFQTRQQKAEPVLILNGQETDYHRVRQSLRRRMGDKSKRPIVLFIGVVAPLRGIEQIVDAFAQINTDALLAIVGPGNPAYKEGIQARMTEAGIAERAHIMEGVPQSDVVPLASTASLGISPISTKTGNAGLILNNKMFQYLAAGLPTLSTDVPGPGGFIKKHGIGYIYQDEDAQDLARVIDTALADIDGKPEIRENIKKTAAAYTWDSQRNVLIDYIKSVEKITGLDKRQQSTINDGKDAGKVENKQTQDKHEARITVPALTFTGRLKRFIRTLLRVPEDHRQSVLSDAILRRSSLLRGRVENVHKQVENIGKTLQIAEDGGRSLTAKEINNFRRYVRVMDNNVIAQNKIIDVVENNAKAVGNLQSTAGPAVRRALDTDKLFETEDYPVIEDVQSPFVMRRRGQIKAMLLNSVGGSMSRLSKAMMAHHKIDSDCFVASYLPRRQLFYAHETNANGIFSHEEWREFLQWAVQDYDIVQSSTLPLHAGIASCYDWLTETIGRRHIWRTTGFIHHYLRRDDVLPLSVYQRDTNSDKIPNSEQYSGKTFKFTDTHMITDPNVVFYSSPEKGEYLQGKDNIWLPSIRDPERYEYSKTPTPRDPDANVKVYVPYHKQAMFKGMDTILGVLEDIQEEGHKIDIVTPENATEFWPDLKGFKDGVQDKAKPSIYPIPNHLMPQLFSRVDVVVDQIIMGCYGNTAIEAMMAGKPVIAQKRYDDFAGCPVIEADADTLKDVVLDLIHNPQRWAKLGAAGRRYALRKHSPKVVGKIAADTYRRVLDEAINEI